MTYWYQNQLFTKVGPHPSLWSTTPCNEIGIPMPDSYFCMLGLPCYCSIISSKINVWKKKNEYDFNNRYVDITKINYAGSYDNEILKPVQWIKKLQHFFTTISFFIVVAYF